jgi:hypothetical protein
MSLWWAVFFNTVKVFLEISSKSGVADPHHFDVDSDPDPHQSDANLSPLVLRPSRASFWASSPVVSDHGSIFLSLTWILSYLLIRIQLFTLLRIRIQLPKLIRTDPQPCLNHYFTLSNIIVKCFHLHTLRQRIYLRTTGKNSTFLSFSAAVE